LPDVLREFFAIAQWLSPRLFMPAGITTLLSGITLVAVGRAEFAQTWIILALVGVAVTIALGATQMGPLIGRIHTLLKEEGSSDAVAPLAHRLALYTRIDLVILLLVLLDMVLKPRF
jgi:hypothetical protein